LGKKGRAMLYLFYLQTPVFNKAPLDLEDFYALFQKTKLLKKIKISFLFNAIPVI
jgi:hypothetical protein